MPEACRDMIRAMSEHDPIVRPRPSASLAASNAAALARIKEMTPLERMALALELGRRCRAVAKAVKDESSK